MSAQPPYPPVPSSPRFPEIEERVLRFWDEDGTFVASVENREAGENGANEFVFYDGPPFANGLPHYGHLLTGYVKDIVPRYQTMRGRRVERRFGWDTHGLPAELEAMSQLGIKTKEEILEIGIEAFNAKCRESVLRYTGEWRDYVTRQARWVDFDHDYKTLEPGYMESVMWAFKQLHDKGLIYEGYRVLPYCWNDQTPLSNHELRMDDDVYQQRQDPAVTVGLRLETGELALAWTTTPWTLPANLGIMVGPDIDYVVVESDVSGTTERYVIGAARLAAYARDLFGADVDLTTLDERVVERLTGTDLLGRSFTPPFDYYLGHARAHRVFPADFVTTEDGTGLVHTAGAFGEEDKVVTDAAGIEPVMPVGPDGRFTYPVTDYEGLLVFDANPLIIDHLKARTRGEADHGAVTAGTVLLRRETYEHSYPHCWRCREPLIYMAVSSWFVEVTKIKQRMLELNEQITWSPDHIQHGQFGRWLENARDWSITRNRFWGSPVPGMEVRQPPVPAPRRLRLVRAAAGGLRRGGHRPAPAVRRPAHPPEPRRPHRAVDDAPGGGRPRRVVRLGVDVVRAGALPVRERRLVRAPLPRRLHRRVHRADARLVLHAARARDRAVRPAGVLVVRLPRHRAGRRRRQDEQVAAQLPRRQRGLRPRRRRRDALVPHVLADPARWQPHRHRARHPRRSASGDDPALERMVVLLVVRQRCSWR